MNQAKIVETAHKKYLIRSFNVEIVRDPEQGNPHALRDSTSVALLARRMIPDDDREHFGIFCLNNKHRLIGYHEVSVGSLSNSIVHPREVFKPLILAGSAAFICVHNHPSGEPAPSPDDADITRKLKAGAELLSVRLLDHVVIGNGTNRYFSFLDRGML
jgi:DNA repair protein RadC